MENSGYLLQIIVGSALDELVGSALDERGYGLEEEWAFGDPDSGERRAIDIVALQDHSAKSMVSKYGTTEFAQALLIECKQSRHLYLIFESVAPPELDGFPVMLGFGNEWVGQKGSFRDSVQIGSLLSTRDEQLMKAPPIATSLSRAEPKGARC